MKVNKYSMVALQNTNLSVLVKKAWQVALPTDML